MNYDKMNDPLGEQSQYYAEEPSYLDRAIQSKQQEVSALGNSLYDQGFKGYDPSADTNYNRLMREGKLGNQRTMPAPIEDRSTDADLTDPTINGLLMPEDVYRNPAINVIPNFAEMDGNDVMSMAYAMNSNSSDTIPIVYDTIEKQIGKERAQKAIARTSDLLEKNTPRRKTTKQVKSIAEKVSPKEMTDQAALEKYIADDMRKYPGRPSYQTPRELPITRYEGAGRPYSDSNDIPVDYINKPYF